MAPAGVPPPGRPPRRPPHRRPVRPAPPCARRCRRSRLRRAPAARPVPRSTAGPVARPAGPGARWRRRRPPPCRGPTGRPPPTGSADAGEVGVPRGHQHHGQAEVGRGGTARTTTEKLEGRMSTTRGSTRRTPDERRDGPRRMPQDEPEAAGQQGQQRAGTHRTGTPPGGRTARRADHRDGGAADLGPRWCSRPGAPWPPWASSTSCPVKNNRERRSPRLTTKITAPTTGSLAASTVVRRDVVDSVVRIEPVAYSDVMQCGQRRPPRTGTGTSPVWLKRTGSNWGTVEGMAVRPQRPASMLDTRAEDQRHRPRSPDPGRSRWTAPSAASSTPTGPGRPSGPPVADVRQRGHAWWSRWRCFHRATSTAVWPW